MINQLSFYKGKPVCTEDMALPKMKEVKFACIMSLITTFVITFTLVSINVGFTDQFLFVWLRSWLIASVIVVLSILFLAPHVRRFVDKETKE